MARKNEIKRIAEEAESLRLEKEREQNRLELEEFEKKFAKKKPKERKAKTIETDKDSKLWMKICVPILLMILSILVYYLFQIG